MATETTRDHHHQLHIVMFPFFAFGHISPFVQLSKKLSSNGIKISFFTIPGFVPKIETLIGSSSSPSIEIFPLEISPSLGLPRNLAGTADLPKHEAAKLITAVDLTLPRVETLLSELKPDFVIFDFAHYWIPSLASRLGIKTMLFSVFSATSDAYVTAPGRLVEGSNLTVEDLIKPPQGFPLSRDQNMVNEKFRPFEVRNLSFMYKSYEDGSPGNYTRIHEGMAGCSAYIAKTCYEMEGPYLDFLKTYINKPFLLTGPLVPEPTVSSHTLDEEFAVWFGQFSAKSVVFCSFGSETFLTRDQIRELALGLELTGLPFFLALNFPKSVDARAELALALPLGFSERTKGKGIVHVGWVPQQLILGHVNVGCYLSHAGFSSIVEALVNDCQLVLLPQRGDQYFNSRLVGENGIMRTGVEVNRRDEDGYFGKEDICAAVRKIMVDVDLEPGKSIRLNQKKWFGFLRDNEVQEKFISDMVVKMKKISMNEPLIE